jgi:hypothetical protein
MLDVDVVTIQPHYFADSHTGGGDEAAQVLIGVVSVLGS